MKHLRKSIILTVGPVLAVCLAACASTQAPQELLDARSAYLRVQAAGGVATQYKPDQVHEAKVALDKAEQSFLDSPSDQKTRDLAYVAQRKSELAETNGMNEQALAAKGLADKDAKQVTKGKLAATGQMLASADRQLVSTQQQLEIEKKAHADADKRAKDAMDRLASVGTVKQETRGTVITLPGGVLFVSGKDTLLPTAQDKLQKVAEALQDQEDHKILVEGHTDSQGSESSNQLLSERRAQAVVTFLVGRGVPAAQIRAQGVGFSRPIADNKSPEGRANNRRVEIVIQPVEGR